MDLSAQTILTVLAGALIAGFTTGFAGFGTGLVASGLWFHALPAHMVPPLVALASVAAQLVTLASLKLDFDWSRARPYLLGGIAGVPLGVFALALASPALLKLSVGLLLVVYAVVRLSGILRATISTAGGVRADCAIGLSGGFLGGFAGLSGAIPMIWLQLRGGSSRDQRAVYQPFNLIVLSLTSAGMLVSGHLDRQVAIIAGICLPLTIAGAWLGSRMYSRASERLFKQTVLILLLGSGMIIMIRSFSG